MKALQNIKGNIKELTLHKLVKILHKEARGLFNPEELRYIAAYYRREGLAPPKYWWAEWEKAFPSRLHGWLRSELKGYADVFFEDLEKITPYKLLDTGEILYKVFDPVELKEGFYK